MTLPSKLNWLLSKSTKSTCCYDCTWCALTGFGTALFLNAALWTQFLMLLDVTSQIFRSVSPMADPDFELRRGPGFIFIAQPTFLPSVISSFITQNKGADHPGLYPRSVTEPCVTIVSSLFCLFVTGRFNLTVPSKIEASKASECRKKSLQAKKNPPPIHHFCRR